MQLSDFLTEQEWTAGRFEIPRTGEQTGIGISVSACDEVYAASLEFRADGEYDTFSMRAAPGRLTEDSSKTLVVALYNNSDFIDSRKIEYGRVDGFKRTSIRDVSALKIRVWTDAENCSNDDVVAVLYNISVS